MTGAGGSTASTVTTGGGSTNLGTGTTLGGATSGGGATGTGGAAGDPFAPTVTPTKAGNLWTFTFGRNKLVVNAALGARVTEFSIDGKNAFHTEGSTFWPSPQSAFGWPPPPAIDSAAYTATLVDNVLTLVGGTDSTATDGHTVTNVSVTKRFSVNEASGYVTCEYEIINHGTATASWAPWENTRIPRSALLFFPAGSDISITQKSFMHVLDLAAVDGVRWLDYPNAGVTGDNDIAEYDGAEGWLAAADKIDTTKNYLFLKQFPDAAPASLPAGQGEIQLWTSATAAKTYTEMEEQGAAKSLARNASYKWASRWSLTEIPAEVDVTAGSETLVAHARSLVIAAATTAGN